MCLFHIILCKKLKKQPIHLLQQLKYQLHNKFKLHTGVEANASEPSDCDSSLFVFI